MQKIVINTNVIISAAISNKGNPAQIIKMVSERKLELLYNINILIEYADVLARCKFNFSSDNQAILLRKIVDIGTIFNPTISEVSLIDEDDRIFYDTAKEANATLITGNIKHYPLEDFIMTPVDFIKSLN